ncbi:uncharacterized protein TNCV_2217201 [Trichonephila clavipes]|nr:uncharacterized protein TNCV_2217201 [Trichonephila clavipes]
MRVWKQWTDEHRTTRKTARGRRKLTSACDDRHLLCIAVNDRTASAKQLVYYYRCSYVIFVNSSMSAAPSIACKGAFIQDALKANHRQLRLQWTHEHRAWQADWHQVAFADESRFNLWDHEAAFVLDAMPVNAVFLSALSIDIET